MPRATKIQMNLAPSQPNIDFNPVESKVDQNTEHEEEEDDDFDLDQIERQIMLLQKQLEEQSADDQLLQ